MAGWSDIPGTRCVRGLVEVTPDGSRVLDVYDRDSGEWVMTVGGRDVTSRELDDLVRRWYAPAPPFVRAGLEAL